MPLSGALISLGGERIKKGAWIVSVIMILALPAPCLAFVAGKGEKEVEAPAAELAQRYKNAEPGESFLVGHITWHLGQEYAIMVYQAIEQAAK